MASSGSSSASWGPYHRQAVGGRRSAIVGGVVGLPPPPPPPPAPWQEVWPPPAKSRPHQPSYPPPDVVTKIEPKEEIIEVELEEPILGQAWEISVVPDAPPLNDLERPAFVEIVRHWLETNLSSYELSTILE